MQAQGETVGRIGEVYSKGIPFRKVVASATTAEQAVAIGTAPPSHATTKGVCAGMMVTALPSNTGNVVVGLDATVQAAVGSEQGFAILSAGQFRFIPCQDPQSVYVDVQVNGEGIMGEVLYF